MIAIVKYNAGNVRSVHNALKRLGVDAVITDSSEALQRADKVIFPGVGEAGSAMQYLRNTGLDRTIKNLNQPFLGICLGMQLLCAESEEGNTSCIGIFPEKTSRFQDGVKIPHMGWNSIESLQGQLFKGIKPGCDMYFVHSYFVPAGKWSIATCNYGSAFSAALQKDNFYGVQFHPEKSGEAGAQILKNFTEL